MDNHIHITKNLIKKYEPFNPYFYNHEIKGSCIGYAYPAKYGDRASILRKNLKEEIYPFEADKLLDVSIEQSKHLIILNLSQIFDYLDEYRKASLICLCDLVSIDIIMTKFKTSILPIMYNDFDLAIKLIQQNIWTKQHYDKSESFNGYLKMLQKGFYDM